MVPLGGLLLALPGAVVEPPQGPDIFVVLMDDVGVDRVGAYGEHPDHGRTPVLDELATRGVLFRRAYANPACTPSRAALLTGRSAFRTGIGTVVKHPEAVEQMQRGLHPSFPTIPSELPQEYRAVALGKWHLAHDEQLPWHPGSLGFEVHGGSEFNLREGGVGSYTGWFKNRAGTTHFLERYATSDLVDDAVQVLGADRARPLFAYIATNAAHRPYHKPPPDLYTLPLTGAPNATPVMHAKAMIEAFDTELGRLLEVVDDDDWLIVLSDNGTAEQATSLPFPPEHAKPTMYEGGIRVPLLIVGPGVVPGECDALVSITDIHATVLELAGNSSSAPDSVSLVPYLQDPGHPSLREWAYSESFKPNGSGPYTIWRQALVTGRHKLIRRMDQRDELYDLAQDPFEQVNLLAPAQVTPELEALRDELAALLPVRY